MGPGFGARSGILTLTIKDKAVLYAAYMPYIRQGGLFIPTQKQYQLGDEVFLPVVDVEPAKEEDDPTDDLLGGFDDLGRRLTFDDFN